MRRDTPGILIAILVVAITTAMPSPGSGEPQKRISVETQRLFDAGASRAGSTTPARIRLGDSITLPNKHPQINSLGNMIYSVSPYILTIDAHRAGEILRG